MNRRTFLKTLGAASVLPQASFAAPKKELLWGQLLHFGINMWSDQPVDSWGPYKTREDLDLCSCADHLRFDEKTWQNLTLRMKQAGMNLILIDLGEAIRYPSHPELAVKGSWTVERFRTELARLRKLGLEPIPKLNFSTAHDTWLKTYGRQVSTPIYYKVCSEVIRDVCEIFDHPRFFHLGYDEETAEHQSKYAYSVVRQGDLWWHDFLFFVKTVEQAGPRPWIWSDYVWHHPDLFFQRMPKSVLQSNWYYGASFNPEKMNYVKAYLDLERAGFDQIPTGSNWSTDVNFEGTVDFCTKNISPEHLKGFLMAPWFFTLPRFQKKGMQAIEQVERAMRKRG